MVIMSHYIVFKEPFKVDIGIEEISELKPHEVLIRTSYTLISTGTELTAYSKSFPEGSAWSAYVKYPFRPGYCNVGSVVKVGENVKNFKVGDRVVSPAGHVEYAVIDESKLVKVPDGVQDEMATFHTIASGVMNSVRSARVELGDSVGVIGLGLLGQFATIFSRLSGAFPLIAMDLSDFRLSLATTSGAHFTVNPAKENPHKVIENLTEKRMLDVVFEVTGNPEVIPWAIKLLRPMGRFIVLSSPRGSTTLDFHDEVNAPSRVIIGTHFSSQPAYETLQHPWTRRRNTKLFFDLLRKGIINVSHLITHKFKWYDAPRVYEELWKDRTKFLGMILDWA